MLGRGYAWLDTGTHESLLRGRQLHRRPSRSAQGLKVACPEEIAFRMGWIDVDQLNALAQSMSKTATASICCSCLEREISDEDRRDRACPKSSSSSRTCIGDARGFFFESFNQTRFDEAIGTTAHFVQDNHSRSAKGVLRGLHYQITQPQGKLIRALQGEIFDVAVDLRRRSPTFGKWSGRSCRRKTKNSSGCRKALRTASW